LGKRSISKKAEKMIQEKTQQKKRKTDRNTRIFIVLAVACVVMIGLIAFVMLSQPSSGSNKVDAKFAPMAKDFTLKDTDGNTHKLSDYAGKPIFLDFTTSWCSWCKVQSPDIHRLYQEFEGDVVFFAVDVKENLRTVTQYRSEDGAPWPFLLDENGYTSMDYGVTGYPYYILLKPDGTKHFDQSGYNENFFDIFSRAIRELL